MKQPSKLPCHRSLSPDRSPVRHEGSRTRHGFELERYLAPAGLALLVMVQAGCVSKFSGTDMKSTKALDWSRDSHLWLEEVAGAKPLAWARERNRATLAALAGDDAFRLLKDRLKSIYDSKEKIPQVVKRREHLYNFWKDERHVRGLWRRTTLEEYRRSDPAWETVLDLDRAAAEEKENWVWHGAQFLEPGLDRCLISLSRGGADASVVREFDVHAKQWVEKGFTLPEAKSQVAWRDRDALYVATDFGPGSLTDSGYPRVIKLWNRGTPLSAAATVFEGKKEDVGVGPGVSHDRGRVHEIIERSPTFFSSETWIRRGERWVRVEKPPDASASTFGDWLLLTLRSDWKQGSNTFQRGSLIAAKLDDWLEGQGVWVPLFMPTDTTSLAGVDGTRHYLILNILDNVRNRLDALRPGTGTGEWTRVALSGETGFATVSAWGFDSREDDRFWMTSSSFLQPSTLSLGRVGEGQPEKLKSMPAFFDPGGLQIQQGFATSRDGTRVPYFLISRDGLSPRGEHPVVLEGYGGFEIPLLSEYDATAGAAWLERGGVYAVANIRGGGEFGPRWHQAALQRHRQRAYDDFIAVAEDLVRRKITSPARLGIIGGSNGGLLMGNMLVQRPELFGAIVCQVPLLDMRRYHQLLAGASWMEEFGNPDQPGDWEFLQQYSPYHQVRPGVKYPPVLFTTSTRDDRVHPGHARKMVARMIELGHAPLYYENIEGGHGGAANNEQRAMMNALAYRFFSKRLGLP